MSDFLRIIPPLKHLGTLCPDDCAEMAGVSCAACPADPCRSFNQSLQRMLRHAGPRSRGRSNELHYPIETRLWTQTPVPPLLLDG